MRSRDQIVLHQCCAAYFSFGGEIFRGEMRVGSFSRHMEPLIDR